MQRRPARTAASSPLRESSTTSASRGATASCSSASVVDRGVRLLGGHDVAGEDGEARGVLAPDGVLEHRAHGLLGRRGGDRERPAGRRRLTDDARDAGPAGEPALVHELLVDRGLALVPAGEQLALAVGVARAARWRRTNSGVSSDAIRSLPPPILSLTAYSSSDQLTGSPASANVWLKAGR